MRPGYWLGLMLSISFCASTPMDPSVPLIRRDSLPEQMEKESSDGYQPSRTFASTDSCDLIGPRF